MDTGSSETLKRISLSAQTAAAIRNGIEEAVWTEFLPGERRLGKLLQVSRPTVRTALRSLVRDGAIRIRPGQPNEIIRSSSSRRAATRRHLIAIITPDSRELRSISTDPGLSQMRMHLAEQGFSTEIFNCSARSTLSQRRHIEAYLHHNHVSCCLLRSVNQELQQWFAAQAVPALVLGSCHDQVVLPSLDLDYRAVCRHAARHLLSRGHRHICLLLPQQRTAGSLASERGFLEPMAPQVDAEPPRGSVIRHDGSSRNIEAKLNALFDTAAAPTGLLVAHPLHVLHVMAYLLKRKIRVPEEVSLISRDHDRLLAALRPAVSHYSFNREKLNKRLSALMSQMVQEGALPAKPYLLPLRFFAGRTVRPSGRRPDGLG